MILSHAHKFIFLKTKKTGGTSVEIALSAVCGPRDVITPVSADDEALRGSLGYPGAQNYRLSPPRAIGQFLRCGRWLHYRRHMTAAEAMRLAGEQVWQDYFTFCFVRNPWQQALSQFHWLNRRGNRLDFDAYIRSGKLERLQAQTAALYRDGETILVDRVCRYEDFDAELEGISARLGLATPLAAPVTKQGARNRARTFRWRQADVDYIADLYRFEIERFGYSFEES